MQWQPLIRKSNRRSRPWIAEGRTIWIADAHRDDGKRFVAGREKKSQRTRPRERPPRVGQEKSAPLSVPFAQLNRTTLRWEEVSQALMRHEKKARPEHDLAFLGEIGTNLKYGVLDLFHRRCWS